MSDIILGGGIAGLSAAYHARQRDIIIPVYEARSSAGGLLDSFNVDGWVFDNAVHLSFASEPEVRAIFDRTPYLEHDAKSLNWDHGLWLPHPVQNNMYPLPAHEKVEMIADLTHRPIPPPGSEITNYRDWLVYQYGNKIAERWPLVYTRKYWTIPAEEMGTSWIGSRMRQADLKEVLLGAMSPSAPNTYYISRMRYPERGGYRAFITPLFEGADIRLDHRATRVDWRGCEVEFSNGRVAPYRRLISTMPLPRLIDIMEDVPDDIRTAAATFFATAIDLISVGIGVERVSPSLWFYIYDTDIMAARVYSPSLKSPNNAPPGCSSLQFEIYSSPRAPQWASVPEMTENCLAALEAMGLAKRDQVLLIHHKHVPYGNVVFDLGMEARRDRVRNWLTERNIILAGRFGEWDYLWSNQSFLSGMRAARALVDDNGSHEEITGIQIHSSRH